MFMKDNQIEQDFASDVIGIHNKAFTVQPTNPMSLLPIEPLVTTNEVNKKNAKLQGAPKFQGIFFIPPLLKPCKTIPNLNLREITKNLLISLEIKGFLANYVKCYSILQL